MSKRIKTAAVIIVVALFAAFACGCVFGAVPTTYTLTYVFCDSEDAPAAYAEGESNPSAYTATARVVKLASPSRGGYVFRGWYTDAEYSGLGFTSLMPGTDGDLTLYARWEVTRPTGTDGDHSGEAVAAWRGFLPYIEKFDAAYAAGETATVTVNSRDELTAYCEYVQYKYITDEPAPTVTLAYDFDAKTAAAEIKSVSDSLYFKSYIGLAWSSSALTTPSATINVKYPEFIGREATGTMAESDYYTQIAPYTYAESGAPHSFAIDAVQSELACSTSNQLFYATMIGARPVPDEGSVAAEIYGKARTTLTDIIADGMTDDRKARAIYDWLVLNVTYDEAIVSDKVVLPEAIAYDAFYLEGVFGSGRAVCDGISKAMTLLCRIEGIPCVRVVGNDHAWNKVYVGGHWYIADATFGDTILKNVSDGIDYSFLSHRTFLVPESADLRYGASENYIDGAYAAADDFDFYAYEFVNNANLKIDSAQEFDELYYYARSLTLTGPYSVDFYVADPAFVTKGSCAPDETGHYCTLFFNLPSSIIVS